MGIIINGQNDTIGPVDNTMSLLGTVSIGGTMTIEDFTNIDSVGLGTFRNGLHVTGGNVGINETSPDSKFHVNSGAETVPARFESTGAQSRIGFKASGTPSSYHVSCGAEANDFIVYTNNTEKLRITSAGNVGINDTNPTAKLSVIGNLYVSADSFTGENAGIFFSGWNDYGAGVYGRNSGNDLVMNAGSSEKVRIASNGNTGIGTNNPAAPLHVLSSSYPTATIQRNHAVNYPRLRLINTSNHGADLDGIGDGSPAGGFRISTITGGTSTERLRITSDGKVGVGVAAPVQMMEIVNTSGTGSQIQLRDTSTAQGNSNGVRFGYNGSGAQIWNFESTYTRFATSNAERLRITAVGNVLVGRTTSLNDNIAGTGYANKVQIEGSATGSGVVVANTADAARIVLFRKYTPSDGDSLGHISFSSEPTTSVERARIECKADFTNANARGGELVFYTCANGGYIPTERLRINRNGTVLISQTNDDDKTSKLYVNGVTESGNVYIGKVHDSTNSNNRTVLLQRMVSGQGFQFSGKFMVNSYTGNAMVDCHITVQYQNQNVEVDVVNATHSSQISKSSLRVVTAVYGSNTYLGIQKNGGGTGVSYINALISGNISGNGGIREVNNSSLGSVTNHGNLN